MAKTSEQYTCSKCQATSLRWYGRCPKCQEFGTVEQVQGKPALTGLKTRLSTSDTPARPARPVRDVQSEAVPRRATGLGEFDRVLGGGLVPGQVVLLAGEPGVGKSTLLLSVAQHVAAAASARPVLYISGEESAEQIAIRARRIGAHAEDLLVADESDLGQVLAHISSTDPALVIIDSVQTIAAPEVEGRPGGVAQVHEVTQVLTRVAKSRRTPLLLIGQSTKDNAIAGPRALEHLVDTVLTFEGEQNTALRMLRAVKNRFGPVNEVVCFEQADAGLREVPDPSAMFRMIREEPVPGTCVSVSMEGRRAMLAEIQALFGLTSAPTPRRTITGLDYNRANMLIAITEKHAQIAIGKYEVYLATVAGARITDPGADLATCLAMVSGFRNSSVPSDVIAIGEVALSGDIRPVHSIELRIAEAIRLGYRRILVPPGVEERIDSHAAVVPVQHLGTAAHMLSRWSVPRRPSNAT